MTGWAERRETGRLCWAAQGEFGLGENEKREGKGRGKEWAGPKESDGGLQRRRRGREKGNVFLIKNTHNSLEFKFGEFKFK